MQYFAPVIGLPLYIAWLLDRKPKEPERKESLTIKSTPFRYLAMLRCSGVQSFIATGAGNWHTSSSGRSNEGDACGGMPSDPYSAFCVERAGLHDVYTAVIVLSVDKICSVIPAPWDGDFALLEMGSAHVSRSNIRTSTYSVSWRLSISRIHDTLTGHPAPV